MMDFVSHLFVWAMCWRDQEMIYDGAAEEEKSWKFAKSN